MKDQTTGALWSEEDLNDPRNLAYDEMSIAFGSGIPEGGNILARPAHVFNQFRTSACTSHSTCGAIHQTEGHLLSPRYTQTIIKNDPKYPSYNIPYGAYMLDSVKLKISDGIADIETVPNDETNSDKEYLALDITEEMFENAKQYKGGSWVYPTRYRSSEEIFDATVRYMHEQKRPVKIGVSWQQNWSGYNQVRKTGIFPARPIEGSGSGHDIYAVAWKWIDGEPYLGCMNSWGTSWGDKGMVWFPRNYTKFHSPIAFIEPIKEKDLKIEKDVDVVITEKKPWAERANAQELEAFIGKKFPLDVPIESRASNIVARENFGKKKLMFTKACTYLGWQFTDVINHLYALSRGKTEEEAYKLNFKIYRKDYFNSLKK
jgi:hypothetical protein